MTFLVSGVVMLWCNLGTQCTVWTATEAALESDQSSVHSDNSTVWPFSSLPAVLMDEILRCGDVNVMRMWCVCGVVCMVQCGVRVWGWRTCAISIFTSLLLIIVVELGAGVSEVAWSWENKGVLCFRREQSRGMCMHGSCVFTVFICSYRCVRYYDTCVHRYCLGVFEIAGGKANNKKHASSVKKWKKKHAEMKQYPLKS